MTDDMRKQFPALNTQVRNTRLAYLDSASGCLKPQSVIDAIRTYYEMSGANVHGFDELSQRAAKSVDNTREAVRRFLNARGRDEIVFTRGTTEGINLVANTFGLSRVGEGDEIIVTEMEHHANIVPWQMLAKRVGATIKVAPMTDNGELNVRRFGQLFTERTKIVALVHASNTLGTINPVKELVRIAHQHDAAVVVDGAQAVAHQRVDVQSLDADFYVFSAHKMYGPTGVGVVYGKRALWHDLPPWQTGGKMIKRVSFTDTTFADPPGRFEAGTPNIAGISGLGAAVSFVNTFDWAAIQQYEQELFVYAKDRLQSIANVHIHGASENRIGILPFSVTGIHPHDVATVAGEKGVVVRGGHHCTQPLHERLGVEGTVRVSIGVYTTKEDIDQLIEAIKTTKKILL